MVLFRDMICAARGTIYRFHGTVELIAIGGRQTNDGPSMGRQAHERRSATQASYRK